MNHITQEQSWVLACNFLPTEAAQTLGPDESQVICNAAIEWHIAQQAASVNATFKKWNAPILDEYAPVQHEPENEPAVSLASQSAPKVSWNLKYADSTPWLSVGNSAFEDWFQQQPFATQVGIKQMCRDSYAAGMGDPLVTYASKHIENVDSVCTSQERVQKTAKSEQVPLTDEQKLAMLKADSYFHQRESYLQGIEDAEKHHGIGGTKA